MNLKLHFSKPVLKLSRPQNQQLKSNAPQFGAKTFNTLFNELKANIPDRATFDGFSLLLGTSSDMFSGSSSTLDHQCFQMVSQLERNGNLSDLQNAIDSIAMLRRTQTLESIQGSLNMIFPDQSLAAQDNEIVKIYKNNIWDNFRAEKAIPKIPNTLEGLAIRVLILLRAFKQPVIERISNLTETDRNLLTSLAEQENVGR